MDNVNRTKNVKKMLRAKIMMLGALLVILFYSLVFPQAARANGEKDSDTDIKAQANFAMQNYVPESKDQLAEKNLIELDEIKTISASAGESLLLRIPVAMVVSSNDELQYFASEVVVRPATDQTDWPFVEKNKLQQVELEDMMSESASVAIFDFELLEDLEGVYNVLFEVSYKADITSSEGGASFDMQSSSTLRLKIIEEETSSEIVTNDDNLSVSKARNIELEGKPQETVRIKIPYSNGTKEARSITVRPDVYSDVGLYPFVVDESNSKFEKNIAKTDEEFEAEFDLKIRDSAKAGEYKVIFTTTYKTDDGPFEIKTPISIIIVDEEKPTGLKSNDINTEPETKPSENIGLKKASVEISNYSFLPRAPIIGEDFVILITLSNQGNVSAKNISINYNSEIYNSSDEAEFQEIKEIPAGENLEKYIKIKSSKDLDPGSYPLNINLEYEDGSNEKKYASKDINIVLLDMLPLEIKDVLFEDEILQNKSTKITLVVENNNSFDVEQVRVWAVGGGFETENEQESFTIKNNSSFEVKLSLMPSESGSKNVSFFIEYVDNDSVEQKYNLEKTLQVFSDNSNMENDEEIIEPIDTKKEQSKLYFLAPIALGVVLLIAGIVLLRKKLLDKGER